MQEYAAMYRLRDLMLQSVSVAIVFVAAASTLAADGFVLKESPGEHLDVQLDGQS